MPKQSPYNKPPLENLKREGKNGLNKIQILKYLFESEKASTPNICKEVGLSAPTVLKLLAELSNAGWIEKKGVGDSFGGRRPDLVGLVPKSFFVLCIDIELFMTHIAVFDNTLTLQGNKVSIPYILPENRENLENILKQAQKLIASTGIPKNKLVHVCISMPGLVNSATGENLSHLVGNNDQEALADYCKSFFGVPVSIENDVKTAALSELRCGKAKGKKNVLVLLMDWGVGLGIIMDGKVRKGTSGFSGEIGHIPFADNGDLCYCGKHGCLETVASGIALAKMAKVGIESGQHSILSELSNKEIDKIEPRLIVEAANKGDLYAIRLLSNIGSSMGKGISTLIQIFNPELVILEGRIAAAKQYITIPMLQAINTYCMTQIREKAQIVSSELGESANLLGCAIESIDQFFETLLKE
ncbi:sugar kinase [Chitinophaga parva]|uniref:Sugar kinase n=1 Tax=Chitinophaga parva TaxID=2169414 RepID=A0A2T7BG99_9BACT|nr:ROK family transcriptional regulator [Chitinophaga parva]PUZ25308.1 sugar kinase [Chitinophaga parva]